MEDATETELGRVTMDASLVDDELSELLALADEGDSWDDWLAHNSSSGSGFPLLTPVSRTTSVSSFNTEETSSTTDFEATNDGRLDRRRRVNREAMARTRTLKRESLETLTTQEAALRRILRQILSHKKPIHVDGVARTRLQSFQARVIELVRAREELLMERQRLTEELRDRSQRTLAIELMTEQRLLSVGKVSGNIQVSPQAKPSDIRPAAVFKAVEDSPVEAAAGCWIQFLKDEPPMFYENLEAEACASIISQSLEVIDRVHRALDMPAGVLYTAQCLGWKLERTRETTTTGSHSLLRTRCIKRIPRLRGSADELQQRSWEFLNNPDNITYVSKGTIQTWQRAVDRYVLRLSVAADQTRLPISSEWLYRRDALGIPHVRTILKRQRLTLLSQLITTHTSFSTSSWAMLLCYCLDTVCSPPGRPGYHDYLWVSVSTKRAQARLGAISPWLRCLLLTWHALPLSLDVDDLDSRSRARLQLEAPLWTNRFDQWQYQPNPQLPRYKNLLTPPSDPHAPLRLEVASISNIYCLRDVFTSCGRWPTAQCFAQRIVTDFAGADTPIPRTRVIKFLYKQLTQLYDRLERPLLDGTLDDAPRVFPWTIPGTNPRKRFPHPRGRVAQRLLPSPAQPRSEHPFLRHKVIQPSKLDNVLHANTWARYVSPVPFDVLFRVRWFLLPVSDKYGNATYLQDRFCHHACRQPETYRHVFHDCRVGKPVWRAHFDAWKSLLLGIPTWTQILFGHDLKIRGQFKDHSRGIRILWTVTCAVTFHALWALRNDKKHRSIQSPPVAVTVNQVVRNIHAHVQSIRRIATVDDDLELLADLDFLQAHLHLPRHQPPQ